MFGDDWSPQLSACSSPSGPCLHQECWPDGVWPCANCKFLNSSHMKNRSFQYFALLLLLGSFTFSDWKSLVIYVNFEYKMVHTEVCCLYIVMVLHGSINLPLCQHWEQQWCKSKRREKHFTAILMPDPADRSNQKQFSPQLDPKEPSTLPLARTAPSSITKPNTRLAVHFPGT